MAVLCYRIDFQVQTFDNKLLDIANAMYINNINEISALGYNQSLLWPKIIEESKKDDSRCLDNLIIEFFRKDGQILRLIKGQEVTTSQGFHILAIGYDKEVYAFKDTKETVLEIHKQGGLAIVSHPFVNIENPATTIDTKKESYLLDFCLRDDSSRPDGLDWNAYCIPFIRRILHGENVNKRLEDFVYHNKIDIAIIPTTDLHAKKKWLLKDIGKSHVIFNYYDLDFKNGYKHIASLRKNIRLKNFKPIKEYVNFGNWLFGFGIYAAINLIKSRVKWTI